MPKIIFDGEPIKLGWKEELDNKYLSKLTEEQLDDYVTELNRECAYYNDCDICPHKIGYEFFNCEFWLANQHRDCFDKDENNE